MYFEVFIYFALQTCCVLNITNCALVYRYGSTDKELDGETEGERTEAEVAVQELEIEAAPLIMQAERRCNRGNGHGWTCGQLAQSGYAMCSKHVKARLENLQRFRAKRRRASTGSDAIIGPKTRE